MIFKGEILQFAPSLASEVFSLINWYFLGLSYSYFALVSVRQLDEKLENFDCLGRMKWVKHVVMLANELVSLVLVNFANREKKNLVMLANEFVSLFPFKLIEEGIMIQKQVSGFFKFWSSLFI